MQCNVVNLTAHCFNFRSLFYILDKANVTLEVEWNIPNGTPGDVVSIVTENGWKFLRLWKIDNKNNYSKNSMHKESLRQSSLNEGSIWRFSTKKVLQLCMDQFIKFMTMGLVLWTIVNALMKFMPEFATQLPLPIYDFFYSITVNPAPVSPAEFDAPKPTLDASWMKGFLVKSSQKIYLLLRTATLSWAN